MKIINKIYSIFRLKSIRNQMIAMHLLVVIPAIVILGLVIYNRTYSILEESNTQSYRLVLESSDKVLEQSLDYCRDITRSILSDNVLQTELGNSNKDLRDSHYFAGTGFLNLTHAMEKYLTGFSGAQSMYVYDLNGKLFYLDYSAANSSVKYAIDYQNIKEQTWFKNALDNDGYEIFTSYNVMSQKSDTFSCVKVLKDLTTLDTIGMIIINYNKSYFDKIFPSYDEEDSAYALVNYENGIWNRLTFQGDEKTEEQLAQIMSGEDSSYNTTLFENSETGWQLVHMIEKNSILKEARSIKDIVIRGVILTTMLLLILTIFLGKQITGSLYQLRDDILRVGKGERYLASEFPNNEVGDIGREFSKMVNNQLALSEKITRSELKTKEAELELLQSNINPHFLYNTLDSLYWMAVLQDADDIAELTKSLSDVFKIALSKGDKFITIREELKFVNSYLYIQNIRFEGKIHVQIEVDDELLSKKIIKLLLQPFVENAVYHGIEPKVGEGLISIRIYEKDTQLFFEIQDNGVGMNVAQDISKGYALRNSMERIKLIYGEKAGVDFYSEPDKGVLVRIHFPQKDEEC